jgi:hypothetical protein
MGIDSWGLAIFTLCLASSSIVSISAITNALSGHDEIMTKMTPYFVVFPFTMIFFCIAFSYFIAGLDKSPAQRQIAIYLFICVAYLLAMVTLHLSTFIIKLKYT